jgi:hypothetical protein
MKDFTILKLCPLIAMIVIALFFVGSGVADDTLTTEVAETLPPVQAEEEVQIEVAQTEEAQHTTQASPSAIEENTSAFLWWGIGIGVVAVIIILYFAFGSMERKTTSEFEATLIDDIVTAMKGEYALPEKDLQALVADIIVTRRCSDSRLADLLRIEYEVEKTDSSSAIRTMAVAIKRQNDFIVKKAKRPMTWEDLPSAIRKEFILKNENLLVYSLYSDSEKED